MSADNVAFITLEDEGGHSNFVVMPDKFEEFRSAISQSDYLLIRGIFEERGMLKALNFRTLEGATRRGCVPQFSIVLGYFNEMDLA